MPDIKALTRSIFNRGAKTGGNAEALRTSTGLSDRAIKWFFIGPTIFLLLAINIFPLLWTVYLSFTNYRANQPGRVVRWVGTRNFERLFDSDAIWLYMQQTAEFVCWSIGLEVLLGFGLALLLHRKFKGHSTMTTLILLPMMLSPALVGLFWRYLFEPQMGIFNYAINWLHNFGEFSMLSDAVLAPWAIVMVDAWMWTPYIMLLCLAGLRSVPDHLYEAAEVDRASKFQQFWHITLPVIIPFLMLAVLFRAIENFKMFDMVFELTSGGPGTSTELASLALKREAFEKWRTGYASAFAIILFVVVLGASNVYVKILNRVKAR